MGNNCSIWETPFTYAQDASVGLVMEPDGEMTALLIVAPGGLDAYPKYIVRFTGVFAATCGEEAGFALDLGQEHCPANANAYIWDASPHAKAYDETVFGYDRQLRHYVMFGGDNFVSIVGEPPTIERVDEPFELTVSYAV